MAYSIDIDLGTTNCVAAVEADIMFLIASRSVFLSVTRWRKTQKPLRIVGILQNAQVMLHVLGVAGSCHEVLARETGGRFRDIQESRGRVDSSDLPDSIAGEITNLALR